MIMVFWHLLRTDLLTILKILKDKSINLIIWGTSTAIMGAYVLQLFGISKDFGLFQAGSIITSAIGFEIYALLITFSADILGQRHINYRLLLPIPNWMILLEKAVFHTINGIILGILSIPMLKIVLQDQLILSNINYPVLLSIIVMFSFFLSCLGLFLASLIKDLEEIDNIIMRILFPIWIIGSYQFSFKMVHGAYPYIAYLSLLSPHTFATEAVRSAILNPSDCIPFWINMLALVFMTALVGFFGYKKLKKKLDFV